MSNDREHNEEDIIEEEEMKLDTTISNKEVEKAKEITCSSCGTINPKSNLFCKNCGTPFVQKVHCSKCGSEMPVYNSFCSKCGGILKQTIPRIEKLPQQSEITPHPSQQQPIETQKYYVAPPPVNQTQVLEQMKLQRNQTFNLIGTIVGFLAIFSGIIGFIFFFIVISVSRSLIIEMYGTDQIAYYYGSLIAMFVPGCIALIIAGASLITYRPDGNAWKGFYHTLRFMFVGFSAILALFTVISIGSWMFYNPTTPVSGSTPFWLFTMIEIPINNFPLGALTAILISIFLVGVILMEIPTIIKLVKNYKKKKAEENTSQENEEYVTEKVKLELEKEKKIYQETGVKISILERRKGLLPSLFYFAKSNPLIGSIELLGASYVSSIILILILTPFMEEGTGGGEPGEAPDPFITILSLAWAGVFEELSFRLILIGLPMIFVMLFRYLRQSKSTNITKYTVPEDRLDVIEKVEKSGTEKVLLRDVFLAFRGKYKKIGIPEWILIGISSLLFGFAHWEGWTGSWGAWKIVQATVAGFFLSYAFAKYGLESSIFIHVTNNVLIGLAVYSGTAGANWISGISGFVVSCLWAIGILKFISVVIGFALHLYYRRDDKYNLTDK